MRAREFRGLSFSRIMFHVLVHLLEW